MSLDVKQVPWNLSLSLAVLAITACVDVWVWIAVRWSRRFPVLPYQSRRSVPWGAIDVALMVLVYFAAPSFVLQASRAWLDVPAVAESEPAKDASLDADHPLQRVLSEESRAAWPVALCVLLAIVVAPIAEELFFRLLLQGWLESVERRMRRRMPWLRRIVAGVVPVAMVALLFAAMHIRSAGPRKELSTIVSHLQIYVVASLLWVAVLGCWLKFAVRATLADLGIVPDKLVGDVLLGLLAFLAVTPPVYAILIAVKELLPEIAVADPIPLLFLGVALGGLYYRTHRIVPSITMHMAFNAVAVFYTLAA